MKVPMWSCRQCERELLPSAACVIDGGNWHAFGKKAKYFLSVESLTHGAEKWQTGTRNGVSYAESMCFSTLSCPGCSAELGVKKVAVRPEKFPENDRVNVAQNCGNGLIVLDRVKPPPAPGRWCCGQCGEGLVDDYLRE